MQAEHTGHCVRVNTRERRTRKGSAQNPDVGAMPTSGESSGIVASEENAAPIVPGVKYILRTRSGEQLVELRAVLINGTQHWSFHEVGDINAGVVGVREL